MNDDERRIITQYIERMAGVTPAAQGGSPWGGGSVPSSQPQGGQPPRAPLPPVDPEADRLIGDLFARHPEARYRITQTAFVQEAALVEAQNRIRRLEWEVENARTQAQAQQQSRGGLFGGMFGGGQQRPAAPMTPPPQPVYPPGYNPQMMQQARGGSGFLGTALAGAAGVAGGMVLGNMLMNAFSGGGAAQAASAAGGGTFANEAVPTSSAWTDPGAAAASQGWGDQGGAKSDWAPQPGGDSWGNQDAAAMPADYGQDAGGDPGYSDGGGYDEEV